MAGKGVNRKPRPARFSVQDYVGKRIRSIEESESGLYWTITFTDRLKTKITVSARCWFDEEGNFFLEDA